MTYSYQFYFLPSVVYFQVSITINPQEARPNEDVNIRIQTEGQALVGLDGIDRSILLLAAVKSLTEDRVGTLMLSCQYVDISVLTFFFYISLDNEFFCLNYHKFSIKPYVVVTSIRGESYRYLQHMILWRSTEMLYFLSFPPFLLHVYLRCKIGVAFVR